MHFAPTFQMRGEFEILNVPMSPTVHFFFLLGFLVYGMRMYVFVCVAANYSLSNFVGCKLQYRFVAILGGVGFDMQEFCLLCCCVDNLVIGFNVRLLRFYAY